MNEWYGLLTEGEVVDVIRWSNDRMTPSVDDFNHCASGGDYSNYEIVPVRIEVIR